MKVVCVCAPADGHFRPLLPIAHALKDAGHEVVFATGADFEPKVREQGFELLPAGLTEAEGTREFSSRYDREALTSNELALFRFGRTFAPPLVKDLVGLFPSLQPDLVIHEEGDYAAPIAAGVASLPYVTQSYGPVKARDTMEFATTVMAPLWTEWGLGPPPLGAMYQHLYLDLCPRCLQGDEINLIADIQAMRPVERGVDGSPPGWLASRPNRPLVYATLGTVRTFNQRTAIWRAVLDGLAPLEVDVVATIGEGNEASNLGEVPANAHIEGYIPQAALLPQVDCVINNGGAGSTIGALSNGIPVLNLPQGTPSQILISRACQTAGVGIALSASEITPESVRTSVLRLLNEAHFRSASRAAEEDIALMPDPSLVVGRLEALGGVGRLNPRTERSPSPVEGAALEMP